MTDVNGRTISLGDKAPGGTVVNFSSLNGQPAVQVQFDILEVPGGFTVVASLIPTCSPANLPTQGWWTCFPKPCTE